MAKQNHRKQIGAIYIRESTEDQQSGYSPTTQEKECRKYADEHEITIVAVYREVQSGTDTKHRPVFRSMITDAMEDLFKVILVFHTSRFARNTEEARHYKHLLRSRYEVDIISVSQPFGDWESPNSFLAESINEVFDEYYSRQLGFFIKSNLDAKRKMGYQLGNPPLGYYKKETGRDTRTGKIFYERIWSVHKEEAELVHRIFSMYASGRHSMLDIEQSLNKEGFRNKSGRLFNRATIRYILKNTTYTGHIHSKDKSFKDIKGKHEPIISHELFNKAQKVRNSRKLFQKGHVKQHRTYLLQGILGCWQCQQINEQKDKPNRHVLMYCETHRWKGKEYPRYKCKYGPLGCKPKSLACSIVDLQVIDFLFQFLCNKGTTNHLRETIGECETVHHKTRLNELKQQSERLTDIFIEKGHISKEEYTKRLEPIKKETHELHSKIIGIERSQEAEFLNKTEQGLQSLLDLDYEDPKDRQLLRLIVCEMIKRVWIDDGLVVEIEPTDDYKTLFESHPYR